jgi:hypothetical protein
MLHLCGSGKLVVFWEYGAMLILLLSIACSADVTGLQAALETGTEARIKSATYISTITLTSRDMKVLAKLVAFKGDVEEYDPGRGAIATRDIFELWIRKDRDEQLFILMGERSLTFGKIGDRKLGHLTDSRFHHALRDHFPESRRAAPPSPPSPTPPSP